MVESCVTRKPFYIEDVRTGSCLCSTARSYVYDSLPPSFFKLNVVQLVSIKLVQEMDREQTKKPDLSCARQNVTPSMEWTFAVTHRLIQLSLKNSRAKLCIRSYCEISFTNYNNNASLCNRNGGDYNENNDNVNDKGQNSITIKIYCSAI